LWPSGEVEYMAIFSMGETGANNDATALHLKTKRNQSYEQAYSIHKLFDNARI
jgi:hypothetical protein